MNISNRRPSIVVAATCFADANPAIKIAIALAQRMNGDVKMMLVEDEAISRAASLPFAKSLYPTGVTSTTVTSQDMTAAYHRDANLIERRLAAATYQTSVSWTFERQSGRTRSLLEQLESLGDLVLVGHSRSQEEAREIVMFDGDAARRKSLVKLGMDIAGRTNSFLKIFTPAPAQNIMAKLGDRASTQPNATESLIIHSQTNAADHFLTYIAKSRPSAVLIGREDAINLKPEKLANLARCPVIIDNRGEDDIAS